MRIRPVLCIILLAILIIFGSWGFLVHRTITQLSVYELPKKMRPLFYTYKDSLVLNATRPDTRRGTDPAEASKHFMDLEYFGDSAMYKIPHNRIAAVAKYTADTLNKYGTLPYVIIDNLQKLTHALRSQNRDSILFYAADLSHYIADAHVPLHTSVNYDGQLTNQAGMHDLWETTVPELEMTHYKLSSRHKAVYLKNPEAIVWRIIAHSHSLLPEMFAKEKEISRNFTDTAKYRWEVRWGKNRRFYSHEFARQYSAALKASINEQLIASADHLADFWYTAWINAGRPDLSKILNRSYSRKIFKRERKTFRKNQLLSKKLLLSRSKITGD